MRRKYLCNTEYDKMIKFNGKWYKLKSIFDYDNINIENIDGVERNIPFNFNIAYDI